MTARDNKLIVTRRILTLIPAAWIALTLFFALIDSPIKPEAADKFDPKNSEYYFAFDTLLAVAFFVVAPAVLLGLCVQVFVYSSFVIKSQFYPAPYSSYMRRGLSGLRWIL